MSIIYIGISGKSQSGKDSAAQFIINRFGKKTIVEDGEIKEVGYSIKRFAFADALKEEVAGKEEGLCKIYGLPYEPDNKHRSLLQFYGMLKRNEDSNYFIKKLAKRIDSDKDVKVAIITDVRFLNECYWLKDRGSLKDNETFLIRINRQGYLNSNIDNNHPSETALDEYERNGNVREGEDPLFDYEAHYTGGLDELRRDALEIFTLIESKLDVIGQFEQHLKQIEENNIKVDIAIV